MRIAMVSEHASPLAPPGSVDSGGQNVHVAALSKALAERGHTVTVYTRRDDASLPARVPFGDGVEVVHLTAGPARRIPKDELLEHMGALASELASAWAAEPPDIVHSHFWMSGLAALGALTGQVAPPVVHTFHALGSVKRRHQGAADTSPEERASLEPLVGRQVDAVIATCADEVSELGALGVPSTRVEVAPCGVDLREFDARGPRERRTARHRLVSAGRLVERKGVDLAVRAVARLRDSGYDVELEVAGGGDGGDEDRERARLAALARELRVADRVHFRGRVRREDMPALLRSADATVCTPWYEPFGIVPLESMACGAPVIAAAVGGLQDSVVDGVTGLHVPPRDDAAIAAAAARLFDDAALRERCAASGRTRVEARYTWQRVAARTERIYESVLSRTGVPAPGRAIPVAAPTSLSAPLATASLAGAGR